MYWFLVHKEKTGQKEQMGNLQTGSIALQVQEIRAVLIHTPAVCPAMILGF